MRWSVGTHLFSFNFTEKIYHCVRYCVFLVIRPKVYSVVRLIQSMRWQMTSPLTRILFQGKGRSAWRWWASSASTAAAARCQWRPCVYPAVHGWCHQEPWLLSWTSDRADPNTDEFPWWSDDLVAADASSPASVDRRHQGNQVGDPESYLTLPEVLPAQNIHETACRQLKTGRKLHKMQ